MRLCGLKRELPIVKLGPKLSIASFNLLGDTQMVEKVSQKLLDKMKKFDFDFLVGPEVKVVPLIYQMSQYLDHRRYIIARKKIMGYMTKPERMEGKKTLVLNGPDARRLKGKKVVLVDDVISTGRTIGVMRQLLEKVNCQVVAVAVVLKQGGLEEKINLPFIYLGTLPLFTH